MAVKCVNSIPCILSGYDRCDWNTGTCVNDDPDGASAIKNTGGRLKNRIDRFKNFEGESSGGYKLFTQQYFIGIGVGVLLGYYLLPKLLKK